MGIENGTVEVIIFSLSFARIHSLYENSLVLPLTKVRVSIYTVSSSLGFELRLLAALLPVHLAIFLLLVMVLRKQYSFKARIPRCQWSDLLSCPHLLSLIMSYRTYSSRITRERKKSFTNYALSLQDLMRYVSAMKSRRTWGSGQLRASSLLSFSSLHAWILEYWRGMKVYIQFVEERAIA